MTSVTVELTDDVAAALRASADARHVPLEQVASEVIANHIRGEGAPFDQAPWTAKDLAAIRDGLGQAERGEVTPHGEVMASIRARLAM